MPVMRLTKELEKQALQGLRNNLSLQEIVRRTGLDIDQVGYVKSKALKERLIPNTRTPRLGKEKVDEILRLKGTPNPDWTPGCTLPVTITAKQVAARYGISKPYVHHIWDDIDYVEMPEQATWRFRLLLEILREPQSGQELAAAVGVSRPQVVKAIAGLRHLGLDIRSSGQGPKSRFRVQNLVLTAPLVTQEDRPRGEPVAIPDDPIPVQEPTAVQGPPVAVRPVEDPAPVMPPPAPPLTPPDTMAAALQETTQPTPKRGFRLADLFQNRPVNHE